MTDDEAAERSRRRRAGQVCQIPNASGACPDLFVEGAPARELRRGSRPTLTCRIIGVTNGSLSPTWKTTIEMRAIYFELVLLAAAVSTIVSILAGKLVH
jgi:hypothetical protein